MKKNFGQSNRGERIASTVQKHVAEILRTDYSDDKILNGVSVVGAESHGGLQFVKIFYYAGLATAAGHKLDSVQKRLDSVKPQIRFKLAQVLEQKYVPDLRFIYDNTYETASRVEELLAKIGG